MSLSSGAYLGSHSTVSQCERAASAAIESLLVWIGPLSSARTTGLAGWPGLGPKSRSSCSRWATKPLLRLVGLVWTMSWARDVIERPQHGDLLGLSRRRHM